MRATPQGAIRTHLFFTKGIHAAITAEIKEGEDGALQAWSEATYLVTVNGIEKQWKLESMQYSCFVIPEK